MTRDEIMLLSKEEAETRASQIVVELADADADTIESLNAELDIINERKAQIDAEMEESRKAAEAVARGAGKTIETRKGENTMTDMEIRNSHEYIEAYANYIKTGDATECRTLFSDNKQNGTVPVPSFVADIVAKRLEDSEILRRVRRMEAAGNVKVGFEINAPDAVAHTEGGAAIDEEALTLGIVNLVPTTYKKFVQISDEALDSMSGEAYLTYIYDEVARGIIKAEENAVVNAILNAPTTATASAPAVADYDNNGTAAIDDFVQMRALLSSAAQDLVIICTPSDYAKYRALQMSASYAVDPFDGLEVLFSDAAGDTPIIGDLSGVMMNLPKGSAVEFKYDDKTLMTSDIVKILGRQPAAIGVVGNKFFTRLAPGE